MKKKKIAKLAVTLGLVGAVGVGGTLAALTAQSEAVTNTFAVGKGLHNTDIKLDEAPVNPETGKEVSGERVQTNTYKNLEQGAELDKDPTVTIKATAADCYVFVEITGLDSRYYDVTIDENWVQTAPNSNIYAYRSDSESAVGTVVSGGLQGEAGLVFDGVDIKDDAPLYTGNDTDGWTAAALPQIVVKACAVQASNNTYEAALAAATFTN